MKIAIAGGSIAGLSAALTLDCTGHDVCVFERATQGLRGRGGGVVVLRHMLRFLESHGKTTREMISVPTRRRRSLDRVGDVIHDEPEILPFSSWDAVYRSLCALLPADGIQYGRELQRFEQDTDSVDLFFDDGTHERTNVLIAADGTASRLRTQLFPDYQSAFAGYIAWRGVVDESAFPSAAVSGLAENFTLYQQPGELFMAFLIPALDGSLEPGKRRFNWLWYRNESDTSALQRHLTDRFGRQHHASIIAGEMATESAAELNQLAKACLPDVLAQLVLVTKTPFIQAIHDALSPAFSSGRVALVGDAACTLRPHTGSGTSKAADDAVSLASMLTPFTSNVAETLAAWAAERRESIAQLVAKGPRLAAHFSLGNNSETDPA